MARLMSRGARLVAGQPRLVARPKVVRADYASPEWKALREARRKDADFKAALKRAKPGERLILDHIVEIKDGGAVLDPKNTQWLTFSEHQRKTEAEKAKRIGRVGVAGKTRGGG